MRTLSIQGLPDKRRQKVLVDNWPEPEGPTGNEVKTETIYSGITNGTERNQLIGGNYAPKDEQLPTGGNGYQNVGRVIEVGPDVSELQVGDVLYMSAIHAEYVVFAEDDLLIKLPDSIDRTEAALFGMTSVAMRTCRNTELKMGERVLIVGAGIIGQVAAHRSQPLWVLAPRSATSAPTVWSLLRRSVRLKPFWTFRGMAGTKESLMGRLMR